MITKRWISDYESAEGRAMIFERSERGNPIGARIAEVDLYCDPGTGEVLSECRRNVALIESAPELLTALKCALLLIDDEYHGTKAVIVETIAIAEGTKGRTG